MKNQLHCMKRLLLFLFLAIVGFACEQAPRKDNNTQQHNDEVIVDQEENNGNDNVNTEDSLKNTVLNDNDNKRRTNDNSEPENENQNQDLNEDNDSDYVNDKPVVDRNIPTKGYRTGVINNNNEVDYDCDVLPTSTAFSYMGLADRSMPLGFCYNWKLIRNQEIIQRGYYIKSILPLLREKQLQVNENFYLDLFRACVYSMKSSRLNPNLKPFYYAAVTRNLCGLEEMLKKHIEESEDKVEGFKQSQAKEFQQYVTGNTGEINTCNVTIVALHSHVKFLLENIHLFIHPDWVDDVKADFRNLRSEARDCLNGDIDCSGAFFVPPVN